MTNIASGLEGLTVPIDQPTLHPNNYRRGDVEAIAGSLARFGQLRPIVIQRSTGFVVAGNHTLRAAVSLDWDAIAAVTIDLDDEEAEAYLVADNRLSDRATNDEAVLAPILERLMLAGRLQGTGYSPDDVDDLLAAADALPEVEPEPTAAQHAADDGELAERFANRSQVALRQFVLMYDQETATEVEGMFRRLERAWGVSGARDVVLEALRRANQDPPVEGLTVEEAERANIVPEDPEPVVGADPALTVDDPAITTAPPGEVDAAATTEGAAGDTGVPPVAPQPPGAEVDDRTGPSGESRADAPRATTEQVERIGDVLGRNGDTEERLLDVPGSGAPSGLDPA